MPSERARADRERVVDVPFTALPDIRQRDRDCVNQPDRWFELNIGLDTVRNRA